MFKGPIVEVYISNGEMPWLEKPYLIHESHIRELELLAALIKVEVDEGPAAQVIRLTTTSHAMELLAKWLYSDRVKIDDSSTPQQWIDAAALAEQIGSPKFHEAIALAVAKYNEKADVINTPLHAVVACENGLRDSPMYRLFLLQGVAAMMQNSEQFSPGGERFADVEHLTGAAPVFQDILVEIMSRQVAKG